MKTAGKNRVFQHKREAVFKNDMTEGFKGN